MTDSSLLMESMVVFERTSRSVVEEIARLRVWGLGGKFFFATGHLSAAPKMCTVRSFEKDRRHKFELLCEKNNSAS